MAQNRIRLNGKNYTIARDSLVPRGARRWVWSKRPSQGGDPSVMQFADWRIDGPNLISIEDISAGEGILGIDYTDGVDSRFSDVLVLSPQLNSLTLSTYDDSIAGIDAHDAAMVSSSISGITYLYVIRDENIAKVQVSDMTLVDSGFNLSNEPTSVIGTTDEGGTTMVSFGFDAGVDYHVITTIGEPTDISSDNVDNEEVRIFGEAPDRTVGLGGNNHKRRVQGNILSGAITMADGNWQEVSTLYGKPDLKMTGFATDGNLWLIGTNYGPWALDAQRGNFFPLMPELAPDDENCRVMITWFALGVVFALRGGLRQQKNTIGQRIGPEVFYTNTGPIQGYFTGLCATDKWLYGTFYAERDNETYLLAARPHEPGDGHRHLVSWHVLDKFASNAKSRFMYNIGLGNGARNGVNELPVIAMGKDTDLQWFVEGRGERQYLDTNYRFKTTSSAAYLTELRRFPGMIKDIHSIELLTENCTVDRTVIVKMSVDGEAAETLAGDAQDDEGNALNGTIKTNGYHRLFFVDDENEPFTWATGKRLKPEIHLVTNDAKETPRVIGGFARLWFTLRPEYTDVLEFYVEVKRTGTDTVKSTREALMDELSGGPAHMESDIEGAEYHLNIEAIEVQENSPQDVWLAIVRASKWPTV